MKVLSLNGKRDLVIKIHEREVAEFKYSSNSPEKCKAQTLPEYLVFINGYRNGDKCFYLNCFDPTQLRLVGFYLPNDYVVTLVSKNSKKNKEIRAIQDKFNYEVNFKNELSHSFLIGSDPEIFAQTKDGALIPAFNFLGSKDTPNQSTVCHHGKSNDIYWDGFQAEFNTLAMGCLEHHTDTVACGLIGLKDLLKKHDPNALLSVKTTFDIPPELLANSKEEHVQFGCMPSLNIYGMEGIKMNGREVAFRSAGGHIHYGIGKADKDRQEKIVKALDAILAVACVSLFASFDDPRRRVMYGLAGEYRLPPHGLEYRVLSNAWLTHPLIMNIVFDLSRKALRFGEKGWMNKWIHNEQETINIINTCDVAGAKEVMERNKELLLNIMDAPYRNMDMTKMAYDIFYNGMESVIKKPDDIIGNWKMNEAWKIGNKGTGFQLRFHYQNIIDSKKKAS